MQFDQTAAQTSLWTSLHRCVGAAKRGRSKWHDHELCCCVEVTEYMKLVLDKLTVPRTVKKFPAFYGTR